MKKFTERQKKYVDSMIEKVKVETEKNTFERLMIELKLTPKLFFMDHVMKDEDFMKKMGFVRIKKPEKELYIYPGREEPGRMELSLELLQRIIEQLRGEYPYLREHKVGTGELGGIKQIHKLPKYELIRIFLSREIIFSDMFQKQENGYKEKVLALQKRHENELVRIRKTLKVLEKI